MFKFGNNAPAVAPRAETMTDLRYARSETAGAGLSDRHGDIPKDQEISTNSDRQDLAEAMHGSRHAVPHYAVGAAGRDNRRAPGPAERQAASEALNALIGKLDQSLQQFAQNASEACTAAADYHAALSETASSLDANRPVVESTALSQLTRTMIERTRRVAADMRRCEAEAMSLRHSLPPRADDDSRALAKIMGAEMLAAEMLAGAAREAGEPLSIGLCRIDGAEAITDAHGHDAGDRVIRSIARMVQRISGHNCQMARVAGDAIVLLFAGLTPEEAGAQLDDARAKFAQRKLVDRKTRKAIGTISFSGAVADIRAHAHPREALDAANQALLAASEQGRDRIIIVPQSA